jgi:gamma-glutamylcyclotransferase (GGCT)/AIG2-like uncharacterized protein YtfP
MYTKSLIAVYGTLKKGKRNHHLLGVPANYVGDDVINNYALIDLVSFPAAVHRLDNKIHTEIYCIDRKLLPAIDILEGNRGRNCYSNLYNRIKVTTTYGKAWMYVWNGNLGYYSYNIIEEGKW